MTRSGQAYPSRGPTCEFEVFTTTPSRPYAEIGTVDVQFGGWGDHMYRDLAEFKQVIEPHVCESGGEAAIALANGYGLYIKATVIKFEARPAAPAASAVPAASGGCEYDAQCKGDRVCVKHECVNP